MIVETRDEPLGEASSSFRRQLQNFGFKSTNRVSHRIDLTTAREIVPRASSRDSAQPNGLRLSGRRPRPLGRDGLFARPSAPSA